MMSSSKFPHDPRSPRSSQSYNGRDCSSRGNFPWMSTQRNPETTPPDTLPRSFHSAAHPPVYTHHTRQHSDEGKMNTNKPSQPPCY
eukprot:6038376-Ditylum_brightwellii.AAC.1